MLRAIILYLATALSVTAVSAGEMVEIPNRWGVTQIAKPPVRVVSLSYIGADFALALDTVPVGFRAWYGGDATGLWPWAAHRLGAARPQVFRGEIDVERVALLKPDLIEAMWSGLSRTQYDQLSRIAPVLAPPPGSGDFAMTWQEMTLTLGQALGREPQAEALVSRLEEKTAQLRASHPEWQGKQAVVAMPSGPGLYTAGDLRGHFMASLGFRTPDVVESLARGAFYFTLDQELTKPLDVDVLVWLDTGGGVAAAREMALRDTLRVVREGREVVAPPDVAAAMSYSSPLSLDYALDRLVPLIEAAADGRPETVVPTSQAAGLGR